MTSPIGLFDSGVGGTTIWKEVVRQLPHESTLFLADSLNAPYGEKSTEEIIALCEKNTKYLLNQDTVIGDAGAFLYLLDSCSNLI